MNNKRITLKLDDYMNILDEYESISLASKLNNVSSKSIRDACNGVQRHAGGFVWRYKDDYNPNEVIEIRSNKTKQHKLFLELKEAGIFKTEEEMLQRLNGRKIFKINKNLPFSIDNYFIGTKNEYEKEKEKIEESRITKIKAEIENSKLEKQKGMIKCPYCGRYSWFINACPTCKMSYVNDNSRFVDNPLLKNIIIEENAQYCVFDNRLPFIDNNYVLKGYPIKDVKALYFCSNNHVSRIGLINVRYINHKKQGIVGDFQGIKANGESFIVENVFLYNSYYPCVFFNQNRVESKKVLDIKIDDKLVYVLLKINKETNLFDLSIYADDKEVYVIENVVDYIGTSTYGIYYLSIDNNEYELDLNKMVNKFASFRNNRNDLKIEEKILPNMEYIDFYFKKGDFKSSIVLYNYLSKKYNIVEIKNEFEDDNTINYKVMINKNDYETINFISYIELHKSDAMTYFGYNFNIYDLPLNLILKDLIIANKNEILKLVDLQYIDIISNIIDRNNLSSPSHVKIYNIVLKELKNKYNCEDVELVDIMLQKYGLFEIFDLWRYYFADRQENLNRKYLSEIVSEIYNDQPEQKIKWKSEYQLYKLIKFYFNDAIFQYKDKFLCGLTLDIYVPSIKTAFEYQGLQHYEVVEVFANNLLSERQNNDNMKKEICLKNGIRLIEWKYDEIISKIILYEKLGIRF